MCLFLVRPLYGNVKLAEFMRQTNKYISKVNILSEIMVLIVRPSPNSLIYSRSFHNFKTTLSSFKYTIRNEKVRYYAQSGFEPGFAVW